MLSKKVVRELPGFDSVAALQSEAFPSEESYTMEQLLTLAETEHIEYRSFWEEHQLCGLLFYNVGVSQLYLFYLAVNPRLRSHGYGTKLLQWLKTSYPDMTITANIEPVGFEADNEEQRRRRLAFYERNGFTRISCRLVDDSGLYDLIACGEMFYEAEYMQLIAELGFDRYHPRLVSL